MNIPNKDSNISKIRESNYFIKYFKPIALAIIGVCLTYVGYFGIDNAQAHAISPNISPIATPDQGYLDNSFQFDLTKVDGSDGIPVLQKGDLVNSEFRILTNYPDQQEVQVLIDLGYLMPITDTNPIVIDGFGECTYGTRLAMHFVLCRGSLVGFGSPTIQLPTLQLGESIITGTYQVRATLYADPDETNKENNFSIGYFVSGIEQVTEQYLWFLPYISSNQ